MTQYSRAFFQDLDSKDELAGFRDEFFLPEQMIYLDGNSLGAMPLSARQRALDVVQNEWGTDLITSWNKNNWFHMVEKLGDMIAGLVGADPGEIVVCDTAGLNLYKVLSIALDMRSDRNVIVMEASNFPTDNYMAQGLIRQLKHNHEIRFVEKEDILDAIDTKVAVVCLTQVHYKTGHLLDMKALTEKAHQQGALIIWDLSHSAGAFPVDLNGCDVDFAVGCGYKYLNGGPGAPGFIFVARHHQGKSVQPLSGWWSHEQPFAFERDYRPADNIRQFLTGTQPIVSLSLLECGLDIMQRADISKVHEKSIRLCDYFIELVEAYCAGFGFSLATPRNGENRGSQISFYHKNGYAVMQALISDQVIGDFRTPDIVRFGFAPLYVRYQDIWDAVMCLKKIMEHNLWEKPEYSQMSAVT